nr:hypothetical protein [Lachnospiraceae bacterium]
MKKLTVNGELTLSCPDGFREMTQEELAKAYADRTSKRIGIWDEARHIILVVQWHKVNVLLAALSDPKSSLRSAEFRLRRLLKDSEYRKTDTFTRGIAGRDARAFRYEYRVQGVMQEGEVYLLKKKTSVYMIYTYTRMPVTEEARRVIGEMLNSVTL